ncbi:MAG: hypothetical protein KKG60_00640 [Nanoarchaeota archaeon]|nr:hypothetical protein [Nanoarchaeota archaeon]
MKKAKKDKDSIKSFIIRDYEKLEKNARFFMILAVLFVIGVFVFHNVSYTGFVVGESSYVIFKEQRELEGAFENFEVAKDAKTSLEVSINSDVMIDLFIKRGRCDSWGEDKEVLFVFENILEKKLEFGNKRESWEDREVYMQKELCFIISPVENLLDDGLVEIIVKEKL